MHPFDRVPVALSGCSIRSEDKLKTHSKRAVSVTRSKADARIESRRFNLPVAKRGASSEMPEARGPREWDETGRQRSRYHIVSVVVWNRKPRGHIVRTESPMK